MLHMKDPSLSLRILATLMAWLFAVGEGQSGEQGRPTHVVIKAPDAALKDGAKVIGALPKGARYRILHIRGDWYQIEAFGKKGWVHAKDVAPDVQARATEETGVLPKGEDEFVIDSYRFVWNVVKAGDAALEIVKTQDTLTVHIVTRSLGTDVLIVTPENAEEIGRALANVDAHYQRLRQQEGEADEEVRAGNHKITFGQSPKHGFSVYMRPADRFSFSGISLDRAEVKALVPSLRSAGSMAAYLRERIDP